MRRQNRVARHLQQLRAIFPAAKNDDDAGLWADLRRLERRAHRLAERYCNEPLPEGYYEQQEASILDEVNELLGFRAQCIRVFLNGDPRGYALKISDADMRAKQLELDQQDWGGFGILCPEI